MLIEASRAQPALTGAVPAMRPQGIVVQLGLGGDMTLPMNVIVARELEMRGSFRFHEEFHWAVDLMNKGLIDVKPVISHTFHIDDAVEAFELAGNRDVAMKVLRDQGDAQGAAEKLEELRSYNEYDCLSTLRLRDWLLEMAASDPTWAGGRPVEPPAAVPEADPKPNSARDLADHHRIERDGAGADPVVSSFSPAFQDVLAGTGRFRHRLCHLGQHRRG